MGITHPVGMHSCSPCLYAVFQDLHTYSLPPANEVCKGYVFTRVCQSFCSQGGMHGWGACMHCWGGMCGQGMCMPRGHACLGDVHGWVGVQARGYVWPGGACQQDGGIHGQGACMAGEGVCMPRGACMAGRVCDQGACEPGGHAWPWYMSGACMAGCVCVAMVHARGMCGWGCAWLGGMHAVTM